MHFAIPLLFIAPTPANDTPPTRGDAGQKRTYIELIEKCQA